jgi:hypothetical protein
MRQTGSTEPVVHSQFGPKPRLDVASAFLLCGAPAAINNRPPNAAAVSTVAMASPYLGLDPCGLIVELSMGLQASRKGLRVDGQRKGNVSHADLVLCS